MQMQMCVPWQGTQPYILDSRYIYVCNPQTPQLGVLDPAEAEEVVGNIIEDRASGTEHKDIYPHRYPRLYIKKAPGVCCLSSATIPDT
jgi:hypothetical protein